MKKYYKTIFLFTFLMVFCCRLSYGQSGKQDPPGVMVNSPDKLDLVFEIITGYMTEDRPVSDVNLDNVRLMKRPESVIWHGKPHYSEIIVESPSRKLFQEAYKNDLQDLFRKYLERTGWKVESIDSDHYGEREYRIMFKASYASNTFNWIFTARDNNKGDWDGKIFILGKNTVIPEKPDCSYDELFDKIIAFVSGSDKHPAENSCFLVNVYDAPAEWGPEEKKYTLKASFYCQYGTSSTVNGYHCFGDLFYLFRLYLEKKGYTLKLEEDYSMTRWINQLYTAGKKGKSFRFVLESESAAGSGYAKILIVK